MVITILPYILAAICLVLLIAVGWGLHRFCLALEERGYLYYRKKPEGGGSAGGVLSELDRLSRPSIQHVVEVKDEARRRQTREEGDPED